MRVQIYSLLALAGVVTADQWLGMENLPDGPYRGFNYPNGSTTMTSLVSGTKYTFHLDKATTGKTRRSDYAITRRDTSCWGYQLDHTGVDTGVDQLKTWAGAGGHGITSCATTQYYGFNNNGVYVYYCINKANSSGNLNINDINYALVNMDSTCKPYEAGYFLWPGTPELVGKCSSGTAVCLG